MMWMSDDSDMKDCFESDDLLIAGFDVQKDLGLVIGRPLTTTPVLLFLQAHFCD